MRPLFPLYPEMRDTRPTTHRKSLLSYLLAQIRYNSGMKKIVFALLIIFTASSINMAAELKRREGIEVKQTRKQVPVLGEIRITKLPKELFFKKTKPIVRHNELLAAGFVSVDDNPFAQIVEAKDGSKELATGDIMFINKGHSEGVRKNDAFYIYRIIREVEDPDTHEPFGHLISILGEVKVLDVNEPKLQKPGFFARLFQKEDTKLHSATCIITETYNTVMIGDSLIPKFDLYLPTMDEDRPVREAKIHGKIIAISLENRLGAENDMIYFNVGKDDGVKEGDVFAIQKSHRRDGPEDKFGFKNIAGKAMVVTVRKNSSTAIVTTSSKEIDIGDHIAFIQER